MPKSAWKLFKCLKPSVAVADYFRGHYPEQMFDAVFLS